MHFFFFLSPEDYPTASFALQDQYAYSIPFQMFKGLCIKFFKWNSTQNKKSRHLTDGENEKGNKPMAPSSIAYTFHLS